MDLNFCPKCGGKIEWDTFCSRCGAKLPVYGAAAARKDEAESREPSGITQTKQGKQRWWQGPLYPLLALILVLVVLACVTLGALCIANFQLPDSSGIAGNTAPQITMVNVSHVTKTQATVTWVTDEPASSQVEYSYDTSGGKSSSDNATLVTSHSAVIGPLVPGGTYHFAAKSTNASGHLAVSDNQSFNTPLAGANGQTIPENVYFQGSPVLGTDGKPIVLESNIAAVNVSWEYLEEFLREDQTDTIPYVPGRFVCTDFAKTLYDNAEKAGIRAAFVTVYFVGQGTGHALNAFNTTDRGLVGIDDTGRESGSPCWGCSADKTVDVHRGQAYSPQSIFPCPGYDCTWDSLGIVSDFGVTW